MTETSAHAVTGRTDKFRPVALLMNLWIYGGLFIITLTMGLVAIPLILCTLPFTGFRIDAATRYWVWIYGRAWTWLISPFVRCRRINLDSLTRKTPAILVINHLSFFDTFFMGLLPVYDVNLTLRSWPFKMFWYTIFMKMAGYLDLESLDYSVINDRCTSEFRRGAFTLFFPEGHRSRDGKIQRFHSGAFKVSVDTGIPIVPLCITGSRTLLPPKELWLMPSDITLQALNPIDPKAFMDEATPHIAMRKAVKAKMVEALQEQSG